MASECTIEHLDFKIDGVVLLRLRLGQCWATKINVGPPSFISGWPNWPPSDFILVLLWAMCPKQSARAVFNIRPSKIIYLFLIQLWIGSVGKISNFILLSYSFMILKTFFPLQKVWVNRRGFLFHMKRTAHQIGNRNIHYSVLFLNIGQSHIIAYHEAIWASIVAIVVAN